VTTEEVSVPAGRSAEAVAEIRAIEPGLLGNLPAGAIDSVEGPLGLLVSVSNSEATRGGTDELRSAVSPDDRIHLIDELSGQLFAEALLDLEDTLPSDVHLVEGSLRHSDTVEQSFDRQVGEAAESISLTLALEIQGLTYHPENIDPAVKTALGDTLDVDELPVPGSLNFQIISGPEMVSEETASLRIRAWQMVHKIVDLSRIRELIRGHTPTYTSDLLAKLINLESVPKIKLTPSWFPRLPWLGMRIDISYEWGGG
jgi:hypothetical protein